MSDWRVTRLAPALGARIDGLDLATAGSAELDRLVDLLDEHHVLTLPGQGGLTVAAHVRVGEHVGTPLVHPFIDPVPEHPAVLQVLKEPDDEQTFGGEFWHCDISFMNPPAAVSILHGIEIPAIGGDTLFANQVLAFDALSAPMQAMLRQLTATHVYPGMAEGPETAAVHPVVRVHPRSGVESLYVNPAFVDRINELQAAESRALLALLHDHQVKSEFQVRVSWVPGQVVVWDNRTTLHYAMNDRVATRRRLQRVTAMEDGLHDRRV